MSNSGASLFADSSMTLGAGTAALIGGGLALFFGTIIQVLWRLRNRPDDVDPRDAIGLGGVILRLLIGLWMVAGGIAWRIYASSNGVSEQ